MVGRHETDFIDFQQRLRAAGKPPKVVRIALAHKLLTRLNAKAREVRAGGNDFRRDDYSTEGAPGPSLSSAKTSFTVCLQTSFTH